MNRLTSLAVSRYSQIGGAVTGRFTARPTARLDQFRGGVLGMGLAPVALAITPQRKTQNAAGLIGKRARAAAFALTQMRAFTSQVTDEGHFPYQNFSKKDERFTLLAAVPTLMRYYDSWELRSQQVRSKGQMNEVAVAEALLLGDLLEIVLCGCQQDEYGNESDANAKVKLDGIRLSGLTYWEDRLTRYDLPTEQQRYYRSGLARILSRYLPDVDAHAVSDAPSFLEGDSLIGSAVCALHYPESYGLAVRLSAQYGVIAPVIAGLLSGCAGGYSSLPVLWQLADSLSTDEDRSSDEDHSPDAQDFSCSEMMRVADDLFAQWAGVQNSV